MEEKFSYKVVINLKDVGIFNTFYEAYVEMVKRIKELCEKGYSLQMLGNANFIELRFVGYDELLAHFDFYTATDTAYHLGIIMKDGKQVPLEEISFNPEERMERAVRRLLEGELRTIRGDVLDELPDNKLITLFKSAMIPEENISENFPLIELRTKSANIRAVCIESLLELFKLLPPEELNKGKEEK